MTLRPEDAFIPQAMDPIYRPEEPYVPWGEAMQAAFETENTLGSYLSQAGPQTPVATPDDFEPLDYTQGYEEYAVGAMDFTTLNEVNQWKAQIDKERHNRQILNQSGWRGVVSMVGASALDPITLPFIFAPIGMGVLKSGQIARGMAIEAGMAVAATAPQEALLHETQLTRTGTETALNVGASALLGGVVGAAAARWMDLPRVARAVDDDFADAPRVVNLMGDYTPLEAVSQGVDTFVTRLKATVAQKLPKAAKQQLTETRKTLVESATQLRAKIKQLQDIEQVRSLELIQERTFKRTTQPRVRETKLWKDIARRELGDDAPTEMVSNRAKDLRKLYEDRDLYPVMQAELKKITQQLEDIDGQLALGKQANRATKQLAKINRMRAEGKSDGQILHALDADIPKVTLEDVVGDPETPLVFSQGGTVSAAKVNERGEYLPIAGEDTVMVGASKVAKLAALSPIGQVMLAKSAKARQMMMDLAENSFRFAGLQRGVAPSSAVESILKKYDSARLLSAKHGKQMFGEYRKAARARGETPLRESQFFEEIGKAMRRGDESNIAEVTKAAGFYRKHVFDPLKKALKDEGLMPEGEAFKTADSYLTRIYDRDVLRNNAAEFDTIISKYLRSIKDDLTDQDALEIARDVRASILGNHHGQMDWTADFVAKGGPLQKRTLLIPDEMIEKFLVNNVDSVATDYVRSVAPRVELKRRFKSGFDLEDHIAEIMDEYDGLIRAATSEKEIKQLTRESKAVQKNIRAVRDRLMGTYGIPKDPGHWLVRSSRAIRAVNLLSMLGGMTLSAIPDMMRPMAVHGFRSYGRGLMNVGKAVRGLNIEQLQKMGTAIDMMHSARLNALADLDDIVGHSRFEKGLQEGTKVFARATLMSPWNTFWKGFSGMLAQDEMLQTARKIANGTATPDEITRLTSRGIDERMARKIASQKLDDSGDMWLSNWDEWTDVEAKEAYQAAVVNLVDSTIVTPGAGDMPVLPTDLVTPELAKVLLQFKTFAFTAQNRMLVSGLQQNDARFYSSALLAMAAGSIAYAVKSEIRALSNDDYDGPDYDNWSKFAVEAIDHSGYLGFMMEGNNVLERGTGGAVGLSPALAMLTGEEHELMSRYAARSGANALLGPTFGSTIPNIMGGLRAGAAAMTGDDVYSSDVRGMRKLMPMQNLFYLRWLFDEVEGAVTEDTRY